MQKFDSLISTSRLDAYIISSEVNRRYFLGFDSTDGWLVIVGDRRVFLTDSRYIEDARSSISSDVEVIEHGASIVESARDIIGEVERIGYEDDYVTCRVYAELTNAFEGSEFVSVSDDVSRLRAIKTPEEISAITKCAEIADKSFSQVLKRIKGGMTERELVAELEYLMKMNGADGTSFDTIVAFGVNSSKPHAHHSSKKLEKGDLILMDFGVKLNGYCSDMTRTVAYSEMTKDMKKRYNTLLSAQKHALGAIKPGMTGREADALAREYLKAQGMDELFIHSLGHGVGIQIHEAPRLSMRSEDVLEENMIVTIEPGIYIAGVGGIRIEDIALVTRDGLKVLSQSNKEIIIV